jgi:hypothetical protein
LGVGVDVGLVSPQDTLDQFIVFLTDGREETCLDLTEEIDHVTVIKIEEMIVEEIMEEEEEGVITEAEEAVDASMGDGEMGGEVVDEILEGVVVILEDVVVVVEGVVVILEGVVVILEGVVVVVGEILEGVVVVVVGEILVDVVAGAVVEEVLYSFLLHNYL